MGQNIFDIGLSALLTYQNALNTTSHNVANVDTPGYSRQITFTGTNTPQFSGGEYVGTGVHVVGTQRMYDSFFSTQMRQSISNYNEAETLALFASQLDSYLSGDPNVSGTLNNFFSSIQEVIKSPASPASREVMLSQANSLAAQINNTNLQISYTEQMMQDQIIASVETINGLSAQVANLNVQILAAGPYNPNDLMDQRDYLIDQLAEFVSVTSIVGQDGTVTISMNDGTALVASSQYNTLIAAPDPTNPNNITLFASLSTAPQQINTADLGGSVGGLFALQTEIIDVARTMLGTFSVGISYYFNQQHELGVDLKGRLGSLFFSDITKNAAIPNLNNSGTATGVSTITNPSNLTNSDYQVVYNGAWVVTRLSDNTVLGTFASSNFSLPTEGFNLSFSGPARAGDSFLIQPTANAAQEFNVVLTDVTRIALGAPIVVTPSMNNIGSGLFDENNVVITNVSGPEFTTTPGTLTPPILIQFSSPTTYDIYDNTNPLLPVLLVGALAFTPGQNNNMMPASLGYGYQVAIAGEPNVGDQFFINFNVDGVSDARNAQLISGLQNDLLLNQGTGDFNDLFNTLISDIGSVTALAILQENSGLVLLRQNQNIRDSVSGVNLDEEAANLMSYQQAYQAAAQVINIATMLFDTLLNVTGGRR